MFNDIKLLEGMIDHKFLELARAGADPISKLDLQFSLMEKNKINIGNSKQVLDFDSQLKILQQEYREDLKTKTIAALTERIVKFNAWWDDYTGKRTYLSEFTNTQTGERIWITPKYMQTINPDASSMWQAVTMLERSSSDLAKWGLGSSGPEFFKSWRDITLSTKNDYVGSFYKTPQAWGWPAVLAQLNWANRSANVQNIFAMYMLIKHAFPTVAQYESNGQAHYYFIDFAENVPFPTPELMDAAAKKACMYGSSKYTKDSLEFLETVGQFNINSTAERISAFKPSRIDDYTLQWDRNAETTYGMPEINPNYSRQSFENDRIAIDARFGVALTPEGKLMSQDSRAYSINAKEYVKHDTVPHWYWPRPRQGYLFVPFWGFVKPEKFIPTQLGTLKTPFGFFEYQRRKQEAIDRANASRRTGFFSNFVNGIVQMQTPAGFWKGLGEVVGSIMHELSPIYQINRISRQTPILKDAYRELENLSGGLGSQLERVSDIPAKWIRGEPVSESELLEALDIAVKAVIVVASGGTGTAIIGVTSAQLSRGSWGDDDVGRIFLAIGEIAAISYAANSSFSKALNKYAEKQFVGILKRELYKETGWDETMLGTFMVELSISSGYSYTKGTEVSQALGGSIEKSALLAVAKQSPAAAVIAMAYSEVSKNGISHYIPDWEKLTSPEDWFDNFNWSKLGDEFINMAKNIDSKDAKRLTGLAIMVATGRITSDIAFKIVAQKIAIRQIERFYSYQPVNKTKSEDEKSFEKAFAQMTKAKNENIIIDKISQGHIPSVSEMETIIDSGTARWASSHISSVFADDEATNTLWGLQFEMGVPEWAKIGSIDMPEWAKLEKIDMPGWVKITGQEQWNKDLNNGWQKFKKKLISRKTLLSMFRAYLKSLWPPGVPLRPLGQDNLQYSDYTGFVSVRNALNFPYDHPMVKTGRIDKKLSENQKQYALAREMEIKQAEIKLSEIRRQLEESNQDINQMG